jgi:anaphase-promoting complex subunit 3
MLGIYHGRCVMGNCFSLQKDHESALKFFQRALQLDSHFTYAHTLCGHEHVAMEDFEEGLTCYRNAIRMDPRHYNAWYGLGTIYFRQEKYKLAEFHFRRALHINSRSSVLHCYLGMALHTLKVRFLSFFFLH